MVGYTLPFVFVVLVSFITPVIYLVVGILALNYSQKIAIVVYQRNQPQAYAYYSYNKYGYDSHIRAAVLPVYGFKQHYRFQHSSWMVSLYRIGGNGWLYPTIRIRCPCFIHNSGNLSGSGNISIKLQPENSYSREI